VGVAFANAVAKLHPPASGHILGKASVIAAVEQIAGNASMDELERWRDANLIAQQKLLKPLKK